MISLINGEISFTLLIITVWNCGLANDSNGQEIAKCSYAPSKVEFFLCFSEGSLSVLLAPVEDDSAAASLFLDIVLSVAQFFLLVCYDLYTIQKKIKSSIKFIKLVKR
jgi:hypothetical protein